MNRIFVFCFCLAVSCYAQTGVEHATITGTTSTAGHAARGLGKNIGKILGSASENLSKGSGAARSTTILTSPSTPAPKPRSASEDPALIKSGITRDELLKRFGDPALKISGEQDGRAGETYTYKSFAGGQITVILHGGKVASVESEPEKQTAEVVVIQ